MFVLYINHIKYVKLIYIRQNKLLDKYNYLHINVHLNNNCTEIFYRKAAFTFLS